jgi:hypothetical protein
MTDFERKAYCKSVRFAAWGIDTLVRALRDSPAAVNRDAVLEEVQRIAEIAKESSTLLLADAWSDDPSHAPNMEMFEKVMLKQFKERLLL